MKNSLLLIWFCFVSPVALGLQESFVFKDSQIEIRPVVVHNDQIYVSVLTNENSIGPVFLAGADKQPVAIELAQSKPQKNTILEGGADHYWIFKMPKLKDIKKEAYFVLIGKNTPRVVKFHSRRYSSMGGAIPDCAAVTDKGFVITRIDRFSLGEKMNLDFCYVTSSILMSRFSQMSNSERQTGEWHRQKLAMVLPNKMCRTLMEISTDGDGMNQKGNSEPMGPILGVLNLVNNSKSENWVVLEGQGYETEGITLIKVPSGPNENVVRQFIFSHGL